MRFIERESLRYVLAGGLNTVTTYAAYLVLLPLESERVKVVEQGDVVNVSVDGKPRYTFPRRDCALLPIPNTTVEMLAKLLTDRLKVAIGPEASKPLTAIEMEVEENFGQIAVYRETLT